MHRFDTLSKGRVDVRLKNVNGKTGKIISGESVTQALHLCSYMTKL